MPTNSERPQPRRQNVMLSRALAEARERPQARRDLTEGSRQWQADWQDGLAQTNVRSRVGGNPDNPFQADVGSPWNKTCMLSPDNYAVDMAWDEVAKVLAVAHVNDAVSFWKRDGAYWYRALVIDTSTLSLGLASVAMNDGALWIGATDGAWYWPYYLDVETRYQVRNTKPVDGLCYDTQQDSVNWPDTVTASYQSESVPSGEYIGDYADLTAAIAAGGTVGDWYRDTTSDTWREITGVAPDALNLLADSEDLTQSGWIKNRVDIVGAKVTPTTENNTHNSGQLVTAGAVAGDAFTQMVEAKANGYSQIDLRYNTVGAFLTAGAEATFDLRTGKITGSANVVDASMVAAGDGVWRCYITAIATDAGDVRTQVGIRDNTGSLTFAGDGTSGVFQYKHQLTAGQFEADEVLYQWNFNQAPQRIFRDTFPEQPTTILNDSFSSSRRIFNDQFLRTEIAPWDDTSTGTGTATIQGGAVLLTRGVDANNRGSITQAFTVSANTWYRSTFDAGSEGGIVQILVGSTSEGFDILTQNGNAGGTFDQVWNSGAFTTVYITLRNSADNTNVSTDNVILEEVSALAGWSPIGTSIIDWTGNEMRVQNDGATLGQATKEFTTVADSVYQIDIDIAAASSSTAGIRIGTTPGGAEIALIGLNGAVGGQATETFVATGTTTYVTLETNTLIADASTDFAALKVDLLPAPSNKYTPSPLADTELFVVDGALRILNTTPTGTGSRALYEAFYKLGEWYVVRVTRRGGNVGARSVAISPDSTLGNAIVSQSLADGETATLYFQGTGANLNVIMLAGETDGDYVDYENLCIDSAVALDGWAEAPAAPGVAASINDNALTIADDGVDGSRFSRPFTVTAGDLYLGACDVLASASGSTFGVADNQDLATSIATASIATTGTASFTFTATQADLWLGFVLATGESATLDNVKIATAKPLIPSYSLTTDADSDVEIFRAGSANFPERFIADCVLGRVTVWDAQTTPPTMWMVFTSDTDNIVSNNNLTALAYREGSLYHGKQNQGFCRKNFVTDSAYGWREGGAVGRGNYLGNLAQRNDAAGYDGSGPMIVAASVNTLAAKVLRRVDTTNLLNQTQDNTNAYWTKTNVTATANTITDDSVNGLHRITRLVSGTTGAVTYSLSVDIGYRTHRYVRCVLSDSFTGEVAIDVDLTTGTFETSGTLGSWANPTYSVIDNGGAWRCSVTGDKVDTSFDCTVRVEMLDDLKNDSYAGTGTTAVVTDWQLEVSETPHDHVPSVTGPTTGKTSQAKQLLNEDIGGGVLRTVDTETFVADWAVSTDLGISNGRDTGAVYDKTGYANETPYVGYTDDDELYSIYNFRSEAATFVPLTADESYTVVTARYFPTTNTTTDTGAPRLYAETGFTAGTARAAGPDLFWSTEVGLSILSKDDDDTNYFGDAVTHIREDYNTGPMVYVLGAWANDTGSDPIGEPWLLFEDFDDPDSRQFTDMFEGTSPAPWVPFDANTGLSIVESELQVQRVGVAVARGSYDVGARPAGTWFKATADLTGVSGVASGQLKVGTAIGIGDIALDESFSPTELSVTYFVAGSSDHWVTLQTQGGGAGDFTRWDDVTIDVVNALEGWAVPDPINHSIEIVNDALRVNRGAVGSADTQSQRFVSTTIGSDYVVAFDYVAAGSANPSHSLSCYVKSGGPAEQKIMEKSQVGTRGLFSFNAGATSTELNFGGTDSGGPGSYVDVDNITVQRSSLANPTFDADLSGWSVGAGWAWSNGTALHTPGNTAELIQGVTRAEGAPTWCELKIVGRTAGSVAVNFGAGVTAGICTADGVYRFAADWGTSVSPNFRLVPNTDFNGAVEYAIFGDGLPDNSSKQNHGEVTGQVTREPFNRCTYAVCCDDDNYVRLSGQSGDELQGWQRDLGGGQSWYFFEDAADVPEIEKDGDDYLLKNGCYAFLMLSSQAVVLDDFNDSDFDTDDFS